MTWTQHGNEGMRRINERLGYEYRDVDRDHGRAAAAAAPAMRRLPATTVYYGASSGSR